MEMMKFVYGQPNPSLRPPIYVTHREMIRDENGSPLEPEHYDATRALKSETSFAPKIPQPQGGRQRKYIDQPSPLIEGLKRCANATCHFHAGQITNHDWSNRLLVLPLDTFSSLQRGESEEDLHKRIQSTGKKIRKRWDLKNPTPPKHIVIIISADSHYTVMVATITKEPEEETLTKWEHWDCMKWMGDARTKHRPEYLRDVLTPLLQNITDIEADIWRATPIKEILCEQQSRGTLDCATHTLTAIAHILNGTAPDPRSCLDTTKVDHKMERTRALLQKHFDSEMEEYALIHGDHKRYHSS